MTDLVSRFAASLGGLGSPVSESAREQAAVLLTDHLVNLVRSTHPASLPDGTRSSDRAATEAVRACAGDRDDVNWASIVHPGAIVWPVVLELGARQGHSGADVLAAASIGYDAMVRLGSALDPGLRADFHLTSLVGPVGAAAAASALDAGAVDPNALGHALSVTGGSSGAMRERSGSRIFHRSHAVRTGIAASDAARGGLPSSTLDLEHGGGALSPIGGARTAVLLEPTTAALATTSVRPFPTGGWNQMVYEAATIAAVSHAGDIQRVIVEADEPSRAASIDAPRDDSARWFSLPHAAAAAIVAAKFRTGQLVGVDAVEATVLMQDRARQGARVTIEPTNESGPVSADVAIPLGHPLRPLSVADLSLAWQMDRADVKAILARASEWFTDSSDGGAAFAGLVGAVSNAMHDQGRTNP